mgnify:CR=1 FL=1
MFQWSYQEVVAFSGEAEALWRWWSTPERWPQWDAELDWVRLDGPFAVSAKGRMKPKAGPEVGFEITRADAPFRFTSRARLPLTVMEFDHVHEPASERAPAFIRHTVVMRGMLAPLFGRLIGRSIQAHLKSAIEKLARCAETMPAGPPLA